MSQTIYPVTIFADDDQVRMTMMMVIAEACSVLEKNTKATLVFSGNQDPTDFHTDGQVGWKPGPFPIHIRAYPSKTDKSTDSFTSTYVDSSGAMVLTDIYASPNDIEYLVYYILHYFAHAHGAGIGEYYSSANIGPFRSYKDDGTWNEHDPYWGDVDQEWRAEFQYDPLMRQVPVRLMRYSSLTAAIINGGYRVCSNEPPEAKPPENYFQEIGFVNWWNTEWIDEIRNTFYATKWDLQYQKLILGRDIAQFNNKEVISRKPVLSGRKVDQTTFDWIIETPRACSLVRVADKQKIVMQHYPIAGHYVYRILNAGMVKESEWRLE